jgi:hypothetical protein
MKQNSAKLTLKQEILSNLTSAQPQQSNNDLQLITNHAVCPCSLALGRKG